MATYFGDLKTRRKLLLERLSEENAVAVAVHVRRGGHPGTALVPHSEETIARSLFLQEREVLRFYGKDKKYRPSCGAR